MHALRGGRIAMIFQEPMTSLSPLHTIGDQISEALMIHADVDQAKANQRTMEVLARVGFPDPKRALKHLSVRALRRPAPARHDRHGAHHTPCPADRGRADDGARRDDAGPDPRSHQGASGRDGHVGAAHHPRSRRRRQCGRRGGGDVSRAGSWKRARGRTSSATRSIPISRPSCAPFRASPWRRTSA